MAKKNVFLEVDAEAVLLGKRLLRTARFGALATIDADDGTPLATRVAVATDIEGAPLILVSALSAHTKALEKVRSCSLLVGEPGKGDPLAHPRLTLKAEAKKLERGSQEYALAEQRYLNRHPKASLYAGFSDFSLIRLAPSAALLNGGFAKAYRLKREQLLGPAVPGLGKREQNALEHMNSDHADAVDAYAQAFAGARSNGWKLTGIDAEGIDLARGDEIRRVLFDDPLKSPADLRPSLVALAGKARDEL